MKENELAAIESYKLGLTIKESAQLHNISQTTLNRRLTKLGLKNRKYTPKKTIIEDIEQKYGKLTVLNPIIEKEGRVLWLCECECGNRIKVRQAKLVKGFATLCGRCSMTAENSFAWKGVGRLSGTCWKRIKSGAEKRNLAFEINIEYCWELYLKQNGKCAISGLEIPFPDKVVKNNFPSLDRIDSKKGYIKGNVQWVHKDVNLMKFDLDQTYFLNMCRIISEYGG